MRGRIMRRYRRTVRRAVRRSFRRVGRVSRGSRRVFRGRGRFRGRRAIRRVFRRPARFVGRRRVNRATGRIWSKQRITTWRQVNRMRDTGRVQGRNITNFTKRIIFSPCPLPGAGSGDQGVIFADGMSDVTSNETAGDRIGDYIPIRVCAAIMDMMTGLTTGNIATSGRRDWGVRFNRIRLTIRVRPDMWLRARYSQPNDGIGIAMTTPSVVMYVNDAPAKEMWDQNPDQATAAAHAAPQEWKWRKLRPSEGTFTWGTVWKPVGTFEDHVFMPATYPANATDFANGPFPYSVSQMSNSSLSAVARIGTGPTEPVFPYIQRKALTPNLRNLFHWPAFKMEVPGVGAGSTTDNTASVNWQLEWSYKAECSISVCGTNFGMEGTNWVRDVEYTVVDDQVTKIDIPPTGTSGSEFMPGVDNGALV
uniref:Uncharacterized protein n=1 Tax=Otus scops CRESS-DNA-virus sp. TaxID=2815048 RepID=A0A8A4XBL6_9VIRU